MDTLQDLWESIPMWVVVVAVLALLGGAYVLFQYLGLPGWMFWVLVGGIGAGVVVGFLKGALSGGM